MKALYLLKDEVDVEKAAEDTFGVMVPAEVDFTYMNGILFDKWMEFQIIWKHRCPIRAVETMFLVTCKWCHVHVKKIVRIILPLN